MPSAAAAEHGARPAASRPDWPIIGFSTPFARLSLADTVDLVADVGWDGIVCPVRDGNAGSIAPERVADTLPGLAGERGVRLLSR